MRTEDSFARFRETFDGLDDVYTRFARRSGISDTEFWLMESVSIGVVRQRDIAERLATSRQTINSACSHLVTLGYVSLSAVPGDGRSKQVVLTPEGEAFARRNVGAMHRAEERAFDELGADGSHELVLLLDRFRDALAREIGSASAPPH
jgi:DNA-binding MarR family transcriptional regulator